MPKRTATVPLATDTSIRRSHISPDQLLTRPDGELVTTVGDIFPYAVSCVSGVSCARRADAMFRLRNMVTRLLVRIAVSSM